LFTWQHQLGPASRTVMTYCPIYTVKNKFSTGKLYYNSCLTNGQNEIKLIDGW